MRKQFKKFFAILTILLILVFLMYLYNTTSLDSYNNTVVKTIIAISPIIIITILFFLIIFIIDNPQVLIIKKDIELEDSQIKDKIQLAKLEKKTLKIPQEDLEEFFKRPMSYTTEYNKKNFIEEIEKNI